MKTGKSITPVRTAVIYAFFGILWILGSDISLNLGNPNIPVAYYLLQSLKGSFFVLISASLIYFILRMDLNSLQESEERYRLLFQSSLDAALLTTPNGDILAANPAACHMFGRSEEEIKQTGRNGVVDLSDPRLKLALEERARSGHFMGELTFLRKDGTKFTGEISSSLFKDKDGRDRTSMVIRDITERKKAGQDIQESEERLALVLEGSQLGFWDWNMETGEVYRNARWAEMLGYTLPEIEFNVKQWSDLHHPEDRDIAMQSIQDHMEGRTPAHRAEYRMRAKDGTYKWILDQARIVRRDSQGKPIRMSGTHTDITERKQNETALQKSEALLSEAQRIGHIGHWEWTASSSDIICSDEFLRIFELPQDNHVILQKTISNMLSPAERERLVDLEKKVFEKNADMDYEFQFMPHSGRARWLHQHVKITYGEDRKPVRMLGIVQDITEHRIAEDALRASEENYRDLVENSQSLICTHDLEGNLLSVNEAAVKLTGFPREVLLRMNLKNALGPNVENHFSEYLKTIREQGKAHGLMKVRLANGEIHIWAYNNTLRTEGMEKPIVRGFARDITERKLAEEKLQESEERFQKAFHSSPVGMAITRGADGYYIDANKAFSEIVGFSHEELIGKSSLKLKITTPDQRLDYTDHVREVGPIYNQEMALRHKSGEIRIVLGSMEVVELNREACVLSTAIDITERKQMEKYQQNFYNVLNASRNELYVFDAETLHFEFVSAGALGNLGYTLNEMYNMTPLDLKPDFTPADFDKILSPLRRHQAQTKTFETRHRRADGSFYPVEVHLQLFDQTERHVFLAVILDITERNLDQEQLRLQSATLEAAANAIVITDKDGVIQWANPAFTTLTGYKVLDEVLGKNPRSLLRSGAQEQPFYMKLWDTILSGKVWRSELVNRRKDGTLYNEEMTITPLKNTNGKITHFIAIKQDITERKQAEEVIRQYASNLEQRVEERTAELVRANRAKDEFLANMSHELRTPLNAILGFSETLLEGLHGSINEKQSQDVQFINSSGQHLLGLINDILDLAKIESGAFTLQIESTSISAVCQSSLVFVRQLAYKKSISLTYSPSLSATSILADPKRLKQILVNLLNNAVKFTPDYGTVELKVEEDLHAGQTHFYVTDSGIGIKPENLKNLFIPFVQLDSSLSRQYEGTGLGLALVKKLVEMHGGSVGVESEVGKGSCFHFSIPIQDVPKPAEQADAGTARVRQNGGRNRILIAEDNPTNMMVTSEYLTGKGYQITEAKDGFEAIHLAQEKKPDLILMDIQMPGMDGIETIKHLRASSQFESVPIIAITALAMSGDRERCIEAGANEYLTKPFSLRELMEIIENLLQNASHL